MDIIYENYKLEPEDWRFNLWKKAKNLRINRQTRLPVEAWDIMGYAMSFEHCIQFIITDGLADKDETYTLRQYIDEYKALKTKILEEIELPKRK